MNRLLSVSQKSRNSGGFSLLFVLFIGVFLVALAGSLLVLSNAQSRRSIEQRERLMADVSAENGFNYLVAARRSDLLILGSNGDWGPENADEPYVLALGDQLYFAATQVDGAAMVLDDYLDARPLPTGYPNALTPVRGKQSAQRWWLYSLGAIQWQPLDLQKLVKQLGVYRVAQRDVITVGEVVSSQERVLQRQVRTRRLNFWLDFNDPLVTLRPETALALIPVIGYNRKQSQRPIFDVRGSLSVDSQIRFLGPLLLDGFGQESPVLASRGQAELNFAASTTDLDKANLALYPNVRKDNVGLWVVGDGLVNNGAKVTLSEQPQIIEPTRRAALQLDTNFAMRIGRWGTSYDSEFKDDADITNTDSGKLIYSSTTHEFNFNNARNGILWITTKALILTSDTYREYTYRGHGTLILTGEAGATFKNVSLTAALNDPQASLSLIIAPQPPIPTTPLPPGASVAVPAAAQFTAAGLVPPTVLADEKERMVTFDCSLDQRLAIADPLVNDPLVRRTVGFLNFDRLSIPPGARAYVIKTIPIQLNTSSNLFNRQQTGKVLNQDTCVVLARVEKGQTEVVISLGLNTPQQAGKVQMRSLFNAKSIPLKRIQATIYAMNPVEIQGSNRILGQLIAPRLRLRPTAASTLYASDQKDRYQVDFVFSPPPPTLGNWLMTLRADYVPRPSALPVTYLAAQQWHPLPASILTADGSQIPYPEPALPVALPPPSLASSPSQQPQTSSPPSPSGTPTPPATPAEAPPEPLFRILTLSPEGVTPKSAQLSIQIGDQTTAQQVEVGTVVSGWQVTEISDSQVILTKGQQRTVLTR